MPKGYKYEKYNGIYDEYGQQGTVNFRGTRATYDIGSERDYGDYLSAGDGDTFGEFMSGPLLRNAREAAWREAQDKYYAKKLAAAPAPKAPPAPKKDPIVPYKPKASSVTRKPSQPKPKAAPKAADKPKAPAPPPKPPVIYNQASSVNNNSLKIASSYQSPTIGGTSNFRRSTSGRNFNTNSSMRINNSLTV